MTEYTTPHIDAAWRDDFVVEMRMADVPGDRIGDALATVDAHCADSEEDAHEAFGTPSTYARSLTSETTPHRLGVTFALGIILGLMGMLTVPRAVTAWSTGTDVTPTVGDVVALAIVLGLSVVFMALPRTMVPSLARAKSVVLWLGTAAFMAALVLAMLLLRQTLTTISWQVTLMAGAALLAASVTATWRDLSKSDPVHDPRADHAPRRRTQWLTALMFPILTALILGIDALFRLAN